MKDFRKISLKHISFFHSFAHRLLREVHLIIIQAAEAGVADSMGWLGELYRLGLGVPVDFAKALSWYDKSASRKSWIGVHGLGILHLNGQGVEIDYAKALSVCPIPILTYGP